MATNRDLLREAIADAKAVKETAIENAKAALTESFAPFLREKLSAKIQEMDKEENEPEMDEMMYEEAEETNEGLDEISLDELLAELEEGNDSEEMEEEGLYEAKEEEEEMSIEDMDEDDLKSFIEDVIKDMVAAGELEAGEEEHEAEESEEEEAAEHEEGGSEEGEEEAEGEEVDEEISLEELLAELETGDESKEELKEMTNADFITSVLGTLAGIGGLGLATFKDEIKKYFEKGEPTEADVKSALEKAKAKSGEVKDEELEEAMSAIETLKSELNEINLLNAKLLYTNKIFRSRSLSESQKIKVLTAFDKATTKQEAQLVYETLQEGLKVSITKSPIKESLGSASKVLGSANAKPIIENDAFARMRELAGIKK
jgi:hypothetical protein